MFVYLLRDFKQLLSQLLISQDTIIFDRFKSIMLKVLPKMLLIVLVVWSSICDWICQKGSYTCTVSRHTFHHHLLATSMHQQDMCLLLLKVEQSAFTQAFFSSLSGVHECSGSL